MHSGDWSAFRQGGGVTPPGRTLSVPEESGTVSGALGSDRGFLGGGVIPAPSTCDGDRLWPASSDWSWHLSSNNYNGTYYDIAD